MRGLARTLGRIALCVVTFGAFVAPVVVVATERPAAAGGDPVMGPSRLTASQIVAWFDAHTVSPYRATVGLPTLVGAFLSEGAAANVRGDVAFAQSIVETGWFSFPAGGYVQPSDNNFAGIGAYGDGSHLFRAPDAQTGVRGQIQLLRRYADPNSRSWNIGYAPVPQLWSPASSYDVMNQTHGWAPTWEAMSGTWASSTTYAITILRLYNSMLASAGLPSDCPPASLAVGAGAPATLYCPASLAQPGRAIAAHPGGGYYVLNGDGTVTPSGFSGQGNGSMFPWDIARDIAAMPDGNGYVVLDGWGGVHPFGSAVTALAGLYGPYWPGWDIARGIAITPSGHGVEVLDGWGGVHPLGDAPAAGATGAYWRGWDIARRVVLTPDGRGAYVLDGWGGIHALGAAPAIATPGYWFGWDIARSLQVAFDNSGNPVGVALLDGWGGLHLSGALRPPTAGGWMTADVWRGVAFDSGAYVEVKNDGSVLRG